VAKRSDDAAIKAEGVINKARASSAEFWEKENLAVEKSKQLLEGRNALAGLPEEYLAQFEARTAATERLAVESLKLGKVYRDALQDIKAFDAQIGADENWNEKTLAEREALRKIASGAGADVNLNRTLSAGRAEQEGKAAFDAVIQRRAQATRDSFADAVSTGILKGGEAGGKAMKTWLEDFFLNQPIQMAVKGLVSGGLGGLQSGFDGSGLGSLLKMFGGSGSTASAANAAGTDIYSSMLSLFGSSFANGGVFNGGVVSSPTGFYSGGKLNQVGENGPEAIIPLQQDSQGRLGLAGGRGPSKSVTIVSSPVINIDARTDRAEVMQLVGGALQHNNKQMMEHLSEAGVLPR
jgi:uncharacterized protein YidB (DUF937 family)